MFPEAHQMRHLDPWYFEGYKKVEILKPNGKKGSKLVYEGSWYAIPGGLNELKKRKIQILFLSIVSVISFLLAQIFPSEGGMTTWVAVPSLIAILPIMYMIAGYFTFLPSREKWEIRIYYGGYRRIYRSSVGVTVILAIWLGLEGTFIIMNRDLLFNELFYLFCIFISLGSAAAQTYIIYKNPAIEIKAKKAGEEPWWR